MNKVKAASVLLLVSGLGQSVALAQDKLAEDPTKVVTQAGITYSEEFKVSGSLSLDPVRKLNASINLENEEWRVGGSWLFDIGIVNFNFGKQEFDHGAEKTSYSIGTFVPLSVFDISPAGWQIFAMAGYSHTEGDLACDTHIQECFSTEMPSTDGWVLVPNASNGGYIGAFALKPLSDKWTLMTAAAYSMGSNDYSGYLIGAGGGYHIDKRQTLRVFASAQDNDYGSDEALGIGYTYQFNN